MRCINFMAIPRGKKWFRLIDWAIGTASPTTALIKWSLLALIRLIDLIVESVKIQSISNTSSNFI